METKIMEKRWYRIRITQKEMLSGKENTLKKEFEMLYKRTSNAAGMMLLKSNSKQSDGVVYYISVPKSFALDLSTTMSNYLISSSDEPFVEELELIAGERD